MVSLLFLVALSLSSSSMHCLACEELVRRRYGDLVSDGQTVQRLIHQVYNTPLLRYLVSSLLEPSTVWWLAAQPIQSYRR